MTQATRAPEAALRERVRSGAVSARYSPGRAPLFVWMLTAAFMLLCVTWSLLTPQLLAPDESAHLSTSVRVSEGFSWPDPGDATFPASVEALSTEVRIPHDARSTLAELAEQHPGAGERPDQMTQHPPLYYILAGGVLAAPGVKDLVWDQSLLLVRLLGALFAAPLVWLSWNGIATLTRSRRFGAVAAFVPFGVPEIAQTMGVTTNDSLVILMAWLTTWVAIKVFVGDRRPLVLAALGAAFGAGCLVKGTMLPFGLLVVLVLFFGANRPERWGRRLLETVWPLGVALVFGGWWWIRNLIVFGNLQPYGMIVDSPGWPAGKGPELGHYIDELWFTTPTTFWGWFGRVNVPLPEPLVDVLTISCLLLLAVGLFRRRATIRTVLVFASPVVLTAVLFLRVSWGAYVDTTVVRGLHGRYFFTVVLALIVLAAIAVANVVERPGPRRVLGSVVIGASALLAVGGLGEAFLGFYAHNLPAQWRDGLHVWLRQYSPLPALLTVAVPALFLVAFAIAVVLGYRAILGGRLAQAALTS